MSDIRLLRPAAGTNQSVACEPEANFIFEFPTDAATLSRSGDDLVMTFEDGATLSLTDFYKTYSSENMPSFDVGGSQVAGADFFTAMNEPDLMPAAGPGGNTAPGGGRYHEYANMALYDGLDRLGGLDVGWPDGGYEPEIDGGLGLRGAGDEEDTQNGIPTIRPTNPQPLDPNTPVFPPDNPDNPDEPSVPGGNTNPSMVRDVLTVHEKHLSSGTDPNTEELTVKGSMQVESPDGIGRLVVGGKTVYENGEFIPDQKIQTDEGTLTVTGFNPQTGELTYEYTLERSSQEHDVNEHEGAGNRFGHDIPVTVTDPDGDSASSTITVVVEDDAPVANDDEVTVREGGKAEGNVLDGHATVTDTEGRFSATFPDTTGDADMFGADGHQGDNPTVQWNVPKDWEREGETNTYHTKYGDITLNDDGTYEFTLDPKSEALQQLGSGKDDLSVGYSITDADGDTDDATLTLHVQGKNHDVTITNDPQPDPDDPLSGDGKVENGVSHVTVYESGLSNGGTHAGEKNAPTEAGNSFTVKAEDGLGELKIGDTVVWKDGSSLVGEDGITIKTADGELQITDITDNQDGTYTVKYKYTLEHSTADHQAEGNDKSLDREFTVEAKDLDGSTASGTITATVWDDAPVAKNDDAGTAMEGSTTTLSGNVVSGTTSGEGKDQFGADGPQDGKETVEWNVPTDWEPVEGKANTYHTEYGDITLNDDGTYEFTLDPKSQALQNLKDGDAELKVGYTITDADGDESDAELTLHVQGKNHTPEITPDPDDEGHVEGADVSHVTVYESGLSPDGTEAGKQQITDQNSFIVKAEDGLQDLTINDQSVWANGELTGKDVTDAYGNTLHVTGVKDNGDGTYTVQYKYTLNGATDKHDKDAHDESLDSSFTVKAKDADGDTASGTITATVVDDAPVAKDDNAGWVTENSPEHLSGNVVSGEVTHGGTGTDLKPDNHGADGKGTFENRALVTWDVSGQKGWEKVEGQPEGGSGVTYHTPYGDLTLYDNGRYDFNPNVNTNLGPDDEDKLTVHYTIKDSEGDTDSADLTITVKGGDDNGGSIREAGVRGHYNPDSPNAGVWTNENLHLQGRIEGGADGLTIEGLTIESVTTTYYDREGNGHDPNAEVSWDTQLEVNGNDAFSSTADGELTLYVVKKGDEFTVTGDKTEGNNFYGTLTLKENGKGSIDWDFHLNKDNPDLLNSLNEGEEVNVKLEYSVKGDDESHSLDFTIKGTDDLPQVQADFSVNPGIAAGSGSAHVEDAGVTDGLGWSGTFELKAHPQLGATPGKDDPTWMWRGTPAWAVAFEVNGKEYVFFDRSVTGTGNWFPNGWWTAEFVLDDGSILHVEITDHSPDGWKFSYSITPGADNHSQAPDIKVKLKSTDGYEYDQPVPLDPLREEDDNVRFNAAGRHASSADEGKLEHYGQDKQLESETPDDKENTFGNQENTHWEGIPVVRLGIKATDPDADGGSGQENLFTVDEKTGLNSGIREGAKVGFQGWDGKLYTWGSAEEFQEVQKECWLNDWAIGYENRHLGAKEIDGIPEGDYLVHKATYGEFFIDQFGNIFYVLDTKEGNAADKLPEGTYANDGSAFVVQDEHGAWSSNDFWVTVKGANEAPEITDVTYEEGMLDAEGHPEVHAPGDNSDSLVTLTGHAQATDRDVVGKDRDGSEITEKVEYFLVDKEGNLVDSVQTEHGRVTIDPETGEFTYTLDSTDENVTHLKKYDETADYHDDGVDSLKDEFFVGARDPHGAVDIRKQEVTIKGTNSAPHIESVTDDNEGGNFQLKEAGVKVGKEDVDASEDNNYTVFDKGRSVLTGKVVADDINDAGGEEALTFSFTVDGGTAGDAGEEPENAPSGFKHHVKTKYGDLWYNEDTGEYQYVLDPDKTNSLNEGEIVEEKVKVTVKDEHDAEDTREFTVQIVGTNDAPEFVGDNGTALENNASVELKKGENGQYSTQLRAIDPDRDGKDNVDYTFKGELQDDQEGSPNPGIDPAQSFVTDLGTFSVDENTGEVTFTVNPASYLMQQAREFLEGLLKEMVSTEKVLEKSPNLYESAGDNNWGLTFTDEGWKQWLNMVDADPDYASLKAWLEDNHAYIKDGKLVVHADVYAVDQYGAADKVEVTVELDQPSVPGPGDPIEFPDNLKYDGLVVREEGYISDELPENVGQRASSEVTFEPADECSRENYGFAFGKKEDGKQEDVDLGKAKFSQSIETPYGTLTIDPYTGEVEFVLDNSSAAVQGMTDKEILESLKEWLNDYSIYMYDRIDPTNNKEFPLDGNTVEGLDVTIHGADTPPELTVDTPVLDVDLADDDNPDQDRTVTGQATTRDPDLKGNLTYSVTGDSGEFTPGGPDATGWQTYTNEYGTFRLNTETGEYYFTADGASAKELAAGESWTGQFTITVTDDTGQTDSQDVTVQVHGANDVPEITEPTKEQLTVKDDNNKPGEVHGKLEATDPDEDKLTWRVKGVAVNGDVKQVDGNSVETEYGTFTLNPDGTYTFESNGKAETDVEVKVTVEVDDGHSGTATQDLDFHINGVNDSVVLEGEGGTVTLSQLWGGVTTTNGQLEMHDLDNPDANNGFTLYHNGEAVGWKDGAIVLKGTYGDLTVYKDGHYTYRVRPEVANTVNDEQKDVKESFNLQVEMNGEKSNHQNLEFTVEYDQNTKPEIDVHQGDNPANGSFSLYDANGDSLTYGLGAVTFGGMEVTARQGGDGHWQLYGSNEQMEDVPIGELFIVDNNNGGYDYRFQQSPDWDQQGKLHVELQVYDGHNTVTETLFDAELTNQADAQGNTISLTGQEDAQASLFSVDALPDEDGDGFYSAADDGVQNADDWLSGGEGTDILSGSDGNDLLDGQGGDDKLFSGAGSDTLFGGDGNDYLNGGTGSDTLNGGSGDDLIVYDETDYAVFGGDGFDVLLSNDKDTDSLEDLLKAPLGGDKPHVQDVELFLKGDNVEDLASMDDLQKYGITVDEENGTVTLGEGWSGSNGTYTNAENGLTLETTLNEVTPQGVDEAAQQAANQIQLTQQG